jgi:uncharacterized protein (DUF2147 family)
MKIIAIILLTLPAFTGYGQTSAIGKWISIDENSGEEKSVVEIYERGGKVYGKVIKLFPRPGKDPDPVCNECPTDDGRFKKKIIGMEILKDMVKSDEGYADGNILDPETGKVYRCKLWLEGGMLKVRGYWGPFYRTQTWKRSN